MGCAQHITPKARRASLAIHLKTEAAALDAILRKPAYVGQDDDYRAALDAAERRLAALRQLTPPRTAVPETASRETREPFDDGWSPCTDPRAVDGRALAEPR